MAEGKKYEKVHRTNIFMVCNVLFSQKLDTLQYDVGKEGGLIRIRELSPKGDIRKVWFTEWKENQKVKRSFSQYNSQNQKITDVDSLFDKYNNLIEFNRKIGDSIEGDHQEFDKNGQLQQRDISLYISGKYIIFQQFYNNGWTYRSIIDGDPPDYISINKERFEEVVKIFNNRLLLDKINK